MSTKRTSLVEILLWLIIVVVSLLVVSPFALGFKIKNDYAVVVSNLSNMLQVNTKLVSYQRGFFSSDAIIEFTDPALPTAVRFKETIIHGPVYLGLINQNKSPFVAALVKGEMMPIQGYQEEQRQLFAGKNPLVYQSVIDYAGNISTDGYVPAMNATLEQETGAIKIQSSGMLIKSYYSMTTQALSGDTTWSSFSVTGDTSSFSVDNLAMSFSANMGRNGLLMGDSNLSLSKMDIQSNGDQFALHDLRIRSVNSEVGSLVNSHAQVNAREIYASNERFGPATLNMSVNGLDANSLKQLQQMQKQIQEKTEQGIPAEQINAMVAGQMIGIVPGLIRQMDMKIEPLKLESELGKLEANMNFSVEGLDQNTPADPMFMLTAINLAVDFSIDEPLMRQIIEWYLITNEARVAAMGNEATRNVESSISMEQKVSENLRGMLDEKWLSFNDGVYTSHITLQQGQMEINGRAMDPMQQIMSQMAPPAQ